MHEAPSRARADGSARRRAEGRRGIDATQARRAIGRSSATSEAASSGALTFTPAPSNAGVVITDCSSRSSTSDLPDTTSAATCGPLVEAEDDGKRLAVEGHLAHRERTADGAPPLQPHAQVGLEAAGLRAGLGDVAREGARVDALTGPGGSRNARAS